MESIQKVITITGVPSSGKSTLAKKLAEFHGDAAVICVDYAYHSMAKVKGVEPHEFSNPKYWQKIPTEELARLKRNAYIELMTKELNKNKAKVLIIEGYGLCFPQDRVALAEALDEWYKEIEFFHILKHVSFENWCKQKGVIPSQKRKEEFENLKGIASMYRGSLVVV